MALTYRTVDATMTQGASKLPVHPPIYAPQRENLSLPGLPPYSVSLHIPRGTTCNSTMHTLVPWLGFIRGRVSLRAHSVFHVPFTKAQYCLLRLRLDYLEP